jgi:hypothetical protein
MRWVPVSDRGGGGEMIVRRDEFPRVVRQMHEFLRIDPRLALSARPGPGPSAWSSIERRALEATAAAKAKSGSEERHACGVT